MSSERIGRSRRTPLRREWSAYILLGVSFSMPLAMFPDAVFAQARPASAEASLVSAEKAMLRSLSAQSVAPLTAESVSARGNGTPGQAKELPQKPAEAKPSESKIAAPKPADVKPAESKPAEAVSPPSTIKRAVEGKNSGGAAGQGLSAKPETQPEKAKDPAVVNTQQSNELRAARARIATLEQELDETRSQLTIAETEVSRLSGLVDSRTRAGLDRYKLPMPSERVKPADGAHRVTAPRVPAQSAVTDTTPAKVDDALHVATVSAEKAELRLGPGKNHSALMTVRQGSRLMVEARQGEWYRVFAPNGERAWIQASLISFGDGAASLNDGSSVRVKGFSVSAEEEAFRKLQRITAGQ